MRLLLFLTSFCISFANFSTIGQEIKVGQMNVEWKHGDKTITVTASAPDDGWVAIGFNTKNDIVGTNLIMVNVKDTKVAVEDLYVISTGNPKTMKELSATSQVTNVYGEEKNGETTIRFTLPIEAFDGYHFDLTKGKDIWLICAFSMEDEFDHHSRFRKHVKVTL